MAEGKKEKKGCVKAVQLLSYVEVVYYKNVRNLERVGIQTQTTAILLGTVVSSETKVHGE